MKMNVIFNHNDQLLTLDVRESCGMGSGDYASLNNKPRINGTVLVGNLTDEDLNLVNKQQLDQVNDIIADDEASMIASKAYDAGEYFIHNNKLYRVTTPIASGATIAVGTNVVQTTVADELKIVAEAPAICG